MGIGEHPFDGAGGDELAVSEQRGVGRRAGDFLKVMRGDDHGEVRTLHRRAVDRRDERFASRQVEPRARLVQHQ